MTVESILRLLPGPYWNEGKVWSIYDRGEMIFSGTWDEAMALSENILSRKVHSYESKTITPRTIDNHVWDGWTKLYLQDSAE